MQPIYPEARMPVVQLSLKTSMDPAEHLAVGRALAPLRDEGILIIGSGQSYHNLRRWNPQGSEPAAAFDAWLRRSLLGTTPAARNAALVAWEQAPAARLSHPREDHLIPLMVAAGAAGDDPAAAFYGEQFMGYLAVSSFCFGTGMAASPHDRLAASAAA
jgi:aromatic ring-opening dioxygenase catalytic subunit (LigB family)